MLSGTFSLSAMEKVRATELGELWKDLPDMLYPNQQNSL